ncbi:MAG: hypothetical protein JRJ40_05025, partial [Deltaproteobacteria bacterium]|nr:hypothetical protein [Deltaproteobacteria bacterium]
CNVIRNGKLTTSFRQKPESRVFSKRSTIWMPDPSSRTPIRDRHDKRTLDSESVAIRVIRV